MSKKKMLDKTVGKQVNRTVENSDPNRIISTKLKALYDSVEQEGIPDRFLDLLEKLDAAERKQSESDREIE